MKRGNLISQSSNFDGWTYRIFSDRMKHRRYTDLSVTLQFDFWIFVSEIAVNRNESH